MKGDFKMIPIINGDIFESDCDIIMHQVNCKGVMGSGVAKQVKDRYPEVYKYYKSICMAHKKSEDLLGKCQFVYAFNPKLNRFIQIVNIFGQDNFAYDGQIYTNYDALKRALLAAREEITKSFDESELKNIKIGVPYLMSCYRGGGDWGIVSNMLETIFGDLNISYYKLDLQ